MKKRMYLLLTICLLALNGVAQNSDKISRVLDYRPAPGQHINRLFPTPAMSTSYENALQWANEKLIDNKAMVGLGSFGGYVIVGFDHPIVNVPGEYDFKTLGNAFTNSSEPGVVMVCQDLNKNGKPDDDEAWYELAGSEYNHAQTIHNYEITYYRPEGKKQNVRWTDNQGGEGTITHISYATQDYMYPIWIAENSYTLRGTKLADTKFDSNGQGTYWTLKAYDWGYVDNHANNAVIEKNGFKIEWAVDANGTTVHLDYIDFIKIHTGQLQEAGWLGETSTEVAGVVDLHPNAVTTGINTIKKSIVRYYVADKIMHFEDSDSFQSVKLFNMQGSELLLAQKTSQVDLRDLPNGIYIVQIQSNNGDITTDKIIIK